jgi:signal transduction histidine kinase
MPESQPITVLLADRCQQRRERIHAALTTAGYRITVNPTGSAALPTDGAAYDVILFGADALEAQTDCIRQLREACPESCLILLAPPGSRPALADALRQGADDALLLPDDGAPAPSHDASAAALDLAIARGLERRRLIRENHALRATLNEAAALREVVALAASAAHAMNQPLTVMSGITELMLLDAEPGDPMSEDMEALHRATERLCDIVSRLSSATTPFRRRVARAGIEVAQEV